MRSSGKPLRASSSSTARRGSPSSTRLPRDWSGPNAKVLAEGNCRVASGLLLNRVRDNEPLTLTEPCAGPIQRAHVIGTKYDPPHPTKAGWLIVLALHIVPLCEHHHTEYDLHRLNLYPYLSEVEWESAVELVGEGPAERRVMGAAWRATA